MRTYILGVMGLIAACSPQYTETRAQPGDRLPVSEARFTEAPDLLHEAFAAFCQGPTDDYKTLGRDGARCKMIPSPDIAASLIVRYDGALEVPHIVVERRTRTEGDGYVVGISYFASVPQKSGALQRVYLVSPHLHRTFDELFRAFGGEPI